MEELKKAIEDRESFLEDEAHRYGAIGDKEMYDKRMSQLYSLKVVAREIDRRSP